jgi:uncharacterized iron-regulated membrane protein
VLIAEALDTPLTLGRWGAAWILILAAAGTITVLAAVLTGAWAWRCLSRRLRADEGAEAPVEGQPATNPADGRTRLPKPHTPA